MPVDQSAFQHAQLPSGQDARVRIEAGTLMQKLLPSNLVEPYLTSQRSVIAGFVHRAADVALPGQAWLRAAADAGGMTAAPDQDLWVLRWRALDIQTYLAPHPAAPPASAAGNPAFGLYLVPGPIPVGTEMYRITPGGEEFIARHDGQVWLRPVTGA